MLATLSNGKNVSCLECRQDLVVGDCASPDVCFLHDGLECALAKPGRYESRRSVSGSKIFGFTAKPCRPIFVTCYSLDGSVDYGIFSGVSK